MEFPYQDVEGTIIVNCNRVSLYFTEAPNLTVGDIEDGYTVFYLSVRVDSNRDVWRATQLWNSKIVALPAAAKAALAGGSTFEVLLPWYSGSARFKWDLTGSSEAISKTC